MISSLPDFTWNFWKLLHPNLQKNNETKILSKDLETSWLKMKFTTGNFKISNKWYDGKSLKGLITYSEALQS